MSDHGKDGGTAFPVSEEALMRNLQGMTLRDYFAAKAMQAMVEQRAFPFDSEIPKNAYAIADAMLEARK